MDFRFLNYKPMHFCLEMTQTLELEQHIWTKTVVTALDKLCFTVGMRVTCSRKDRA